MIYCNAKELNKSKKAFPCNPSCTLPMLKAQTSPGTVHRSLRKNKASDKRWYFQKRWTATAEIGAPSPGKKERDYAKNSRKNAPRPHVLWTHPHKVTDEALSVQLFQLLELRFSKVTPRFQSHLWQTPFGHIAQIATSFKCKRSILSGVGTFVANSRCTRIVRGQPQQTFNNKRVILADKHLPTSDPGHVIDKRYQKRPIKSICASSIDTSTYGQSWKILTGIMFNTIIQKQKKLKKRKSHEAQYQVFFSAINTDLLNACETR